MAENEVEKLEKENAKLRDELRRTETKREAEANERTAEQRVSKLKKENETLKSRIAAAKAVAGQVAAAPQPVAAKTGTTEKDGK